MGLDVARDEGEATTLFVGLCVASRLRGVSSWPLAFLHGHRPPIEEHLWALTESALPHQHIATTDAREDAHATRCVAVPVRRDLVTSTTLFHWWSRRIRTLHQLNQPSSTFPSQGKHRSASVISSRIISGLAPAHPILLQQPSSHAGRRGQWASTAQPLYRSYSRSCRPC